LSFCLSGCRRTPCARRNWHRIGRSGGGFGFPGPLRVGCLRSTMPLRIPTFEHFLCSLLTYWVLYINSFMTPLATKSGYICRVGYAQLRASDARLLPPSWSWKFEAGIASSGAQGRLGLAARASAVASGGSEWRLLESGEGTCGIRRSFTYFPNCLPSAGVRAHSRGSGAGKLVS